MSELNYSNAAVLPLIIMDEAVPGIIQVPIDFTGTDIVLSGPFKFAASTGTSGQNVVFANTPAISGKVLTITIGPLSPGVYHWDCSSAGNGVLLKGSIKVNSIISK